MLKISIFIFLFLFVCPLYAQTFYGVSYPAKWADNLGSIYKYNAGTNKYENLYSIKPDNIGCSPDFEMLPYNGKFYGATTACGKNGVGVIFQWDSQTNQYVVLYDFQQDNGANPYGGFVVLNNKLYGTTNKGGTNNVGVIFEFNLSNNTYTKLFDFDLPNSGGSPLAKLTLFNSKIYGLTTSGGSGTSVGTGENNQAYGTIFEFDPATNTFTKKISLTPNTGLNPRGALVVANNLLYGTTFFGGTNDKGTIFEWNPTTNVFNKKIDVDRTNDASFTFGQGIENTMTFFNNRFYFNYYQSNSFQGVFEWNPTTNQLITRNKLFSANFGVPFGELKPYMGRLYAISSYSIFSFDPNDNSAITNVRRETTDFVEYNAQLNNRKRIVIHNNKLYGTNRASIFNSIPSGVIYEWDFSSPNTTLRLVLNSNAKGGLMDGQLTFLNGKFYGQCKIGGVNNLGVIFEFDPTTNTYTKKVDMDALESLGSDLNAPLLAYQGKLYGQSRFSKYFMFGGTSRNWASLFEIDPQSGNITKRKNILPSLNGVSQRSVGGFKTYNNRLFIALDMDGTESGIYEWDLVNNTTIKLLQSYFGEPIGPFTYFNNIFYLPVYTSSTNGYFYRFDLNNLSQTFPLGTEYGIGFTASNGKNVNGEMVVCDDKLYGVAATGGAFDYGTIYEYDPFYLNSFPNKKFDFSQTTGGKAWGCKMTNYNNKLYGVTTQGGEFNQGVIFEWEPSTNIYTKKYNFNGDNAGVAYAELFCVNLNAPALNLPVFLNPNNFQLKWNVITGANSYVIDVATDENFTNFLSGYQNKIINGTETTITNTNFFTTYYCRVRAANTIGESANSNIVMSVTTNLESNELSQSIKVYPNPANEVINLKISNPKFNNLKLTIKNSVNVTLKTMVLDTNVESNIINIDDFPNGLYFLHFESGNATHTTKIIKQK